MEKTIEERITELEKKVAELEEEVQAQPITESQIININGLRIEHGLKPILGGDVDLIPISGAVVKK